MPEPTTATTAGTSPQYDTVEEERQHRKQRLAAGFRLFGKFGFEEGIAGHITARDPERLDHFWVNPFGMSFCHITVSDLILVNSRGEVVEGEGSVNTAAFAIHSTIHEARPDVIAAAHSHSVHGKAWSSLGRLLDPLTQDACAFYDDHAFFDDYTGVVVDVEEGKRIAHALEDKQGGHPPQPRPAHGRDTRWRKRCGGSSPWSAPARPNCWPRPRARRSRSRPRWPGYPDPGGRTGRRVLQLPAALPAHHPRAARPPGLTHRRRLTERRTTPSIRQVRYAVDRVERARLPPRALQRRSRRAPSPSRAAACAPTRHNAS